MARSSVGARPASKGRVTPSTVDASGRRGPTAPRSGPGSSKTASAVTNGGGAYRVLFEQSPHPSWVYDVETLAFLAVNEAAVQAYGYSQAEFLAMSVNRIRAAEESAHRESAPPSASGDDRSGLRRHRRKDGSPLDVEMSVVEVTLDGRRCGFVVATDTSKQRRDALHDSLTGLPNRTLFLERLEGALLRAKRHRAYMFAVMVVDLDRFRAVNESLGRTLGDELLVKASQLLSASIRPGDTVARLGDDEFTILLDDVSDEFYASRVAGSIHQALLTPFHLGGREAFSTASIGIALSSPRYEHAEDILRDAGTAMARAKTLGKSRHEIFDQSMHQRAVAMLELETELRRALERKEFRVVYQPIVSLQDGALKGFEALLRWESPVRGTVLPVEFIAFAEETGLIHPIGSWVLREACQEMRGWLADDGLNTRRLWMSVNLSSKQFLQPGLLREIDEVMREARLDAHRLKLEITESALMQDPDSAAAMLRELRGQGYGLCIDDFGTGYSSLSYLLRFPIDTLKIDRTFIAGLDRAGQNQELVRMIVALARNLSMEVIAEGVETEAQRIRLEALGCDQAQGFLFSKPLDGQAARAVARALIP